MAHARVVVPALLAALLACSGAGGARPPPRTYGGVRPVTLGLPASVEAGKRYPLVLVLHGYGSVGAWHLQYFGLSALAGEAGAFVLAPDGTLDSAGKRFWDATPACCGFSGPDVDDVAYLGGLLDEVMEDWPVDPSRVVVLGHSNGSFMAYRLACERSDVVTAIAGLAGASVSGGLACEPERPVSVLHAHGDADTVIRYDGGDFGTGSYPGARASVERWAELAGCGGPWTEGGPIDVAADVPGAETVTRTAAGCPDGVDVTLWTIQGGSHVPSVSGGAGREMVRWLLEHPRP